METRPRYDVDVPLSRSHAHSRALAPALSDGPLVVEYEPGRWLNLSMVIGVAVMDDSADDLEVRLAAPDDFARGPLSIIISGEARELVLAYVRHRAARVRQELLLLID